MRCLTLLVCVVTFSCTLLAQQPQTRLATTKVDAVQIRPMPPEITRRYTVLSAKIQPSARSWILQRARLESQKNTLDVTSLKADAKGHFQPTNGNMTDGDLEALAFLVLMDAAKSAEDDLNLIMAETKAITNSKQALRDILSEVNRDVASSDKSKPSAPCNTPTCRSLAVRVSQIEAQAPASPKVRRLQVRPNPTFADLNTVQSDFKSRLDSMNEMSEMTSMRLQMAMDRRSKFMDALSNIMKKISDTSESVVQNIK
jgi:hypothetical protein